MQMSVYDLITYTSCRPSSPPANASYAIWLARAAREPQHLGHVLRGVKLLDDRFANPAYGLLLVTGLLNVVVGGSRSRPSGSARRSFCGSSW
jgi:hypothetical protein